MSDSKYWYAAGAGILGAALDPAALKSRGRIERWGHRALIHHREDADEFYVVVNGKVEVDGPTTVRLRPGDLFGIREGETSPAFRAYDETTIVAVTRSQFDELVDSNGLLVSARARNGVRLVDVSIELPFDAIVGVDPALRLSNALYLAAKAKGERTGDVAKLPNLKPRHLGALSVLDRGAVVRAFNALLDESLIDSPAGALVIPSMERLLTTIEEKS